MSNFTKPSFTHPPFQGFVEWGEIGEGPKLMIGSNPGVLISLSGWRRGGEILYLLDFIHDYKHFGTVSFFKPRCYFINKASVYPEIFMDRIMSLSKKHPALTDFILWNLL